MSLTASRVRSMRPAAAAKTEVGWPDKVLDGGLAPFIEAYLKSRADAGRAHFRESSNVGRFHVRCCPSR